MIFVAGPLPLCAGREKKFGPVMETLRTMSLFVAVAHQGSLSAAGRKLGLSPASVSRQITALEEQLGARLLNRTSRSMTLTGTGEIYLRHAENILHQVEEMQAEVSQREQQPSGFYTDWWLARTEHQRMGTANHFSVPNQVVAAADGDVVIIAPSDDMWRRLARALDPATLEQRHCSSAEGWRFWSGKLKATDSLRSLAVR